MNTPGKKKWNKQLMKMIYILQVIGDRIILNDNYEGTIILDYKINMSRRIIR